MSDLYLRLPDPQAASPPLERLPLGRVMVNAGIISQNDLVHALDLQRHIDAPLGEILVSEGLASPHDVLHMVSRQHNIPVAEDGRSSVGRGQPPRSLSPLARLSRIRGAADVAGSCG